jgi:hypothetical protein
MNSLIAPFEVQTATTTGVRKAQAPSCITTTLYDLIAAMQTVVGPRQDDLVVATVVHWLRTGRLIMLDRRQRTVQIWPRSRRRPLRIDDSPEHE